MHFVSVEEITDYVHRHVSGEHFDQRAIIRELDLAMPETTKDELDAEIQMAELLDAGMLARHQYID